MHEIETHLKLRIHDKNKLTNLLECNKSWINQKLKGIKRTIYKWSTNNDNGKCETIQYFNRLTIGHHS